MLAKKGIFNERTMLMILAIENINYIIVYIYTQHIKASKQKKTHINRQTEGKGGHIPSDHTETNHRGRKELVGCWFSSWCTLWQRSVSL